MSADERIAGLVARLETGDAKIRAAQAAGKDVTAMEDWWLHLLNEYERATDAKRQAEGRR